MGKEYVFEQKKEKTFLELEVGDVVVCEDEYDREPNNHVFRVDSIEKDKEYATDTNKEGMVVYGVDLTYYDTKTDEMVGDEYVGQVNEGNFKGMANLQDHLWVLEANATLTYKTKYFDYHFVKDDSFDIAEDCYENNIVCVTICDKTGRNVGTTSDCHLNDITFDEETLDKTFVEGVKKPFSFVNELIDDDFPHQSFDEWEENLAKDAPEMEMEEEKDL